ncbi:hypothetical protein BCR39DRAFT_534974 [Naematelia encephala]|uniref:Uncharacterized protein n=1 Tax=Naematelia encephala TaxID=71784 RepID=A0A1Y2B102_9TREE|nr:hypothetical protein BCR39DRAFT_534974 [Naematelia encephala]
MSFIKKKLGALLPGDSARGVLQNVLTVEWEGHKTVLVEVPAGPNKSTDVEMLGMGESSRGYGAYGRLGDDDDEERVALTSSYNQTQSPRRDRRSSAAKNQKSLPALPERPAPVRQQSNNPFLWDEVDDFGFTKAEITGDSTSFYKNTSYNNAPIKPDAKVDGRRYDSFGAPGGSGGQANKAGNPWSGNGRPANWDGRMSVSSPTTSSSSRATAESFTIDEDPFR